MALTDAHTLWKRVGPSNIGDDIDDTWYMHTAGQGVSKKLE
jgi:hypothetical protein